MVILEFQKRLNEIDSHQIILNFGETVEQPEIPIIDNPVDEEPFKLPLLASFGVNYQQAKISNNSVESSWDSPKVITQQDDLTWQQAKQIQAVTTSDYGSTLTKHHAYMLVQQQALTLYHNTAVIWQENQRLKLYSELPYNVAQPLFLDRLLKWQEMVRLRQYGDFIFQQANGLKRSPFLLMWNVGLYQYQNNNLVWQIGRAVYYRKSYIDPIAPKTKPKYIGSTILEFNCECYDVDSHNVILHFGSDDCLPYIEPNQNKQWWYIMNEINVTRLDTGENILVTQGNIQSDVNSWCWSYDLTVPKSELSKLNPIDNQPVFLKLNINGYIHLMLLENKSRSWQFASEYYRLIGRSPSALLDSPYSATRSYTQENERTSVQLAQAELDRAINSLSSRFKLEMVLNWQLIEELGWVIPSDLLSYNGLSPISAIKLIAESAGGFILSEPDQFKLSIKPLYAKTFWDYLTVDDYQAIIPKSIVTDLSTDYAYLPDYNGITLTNDRTGLTAFVNRRDTAGDVLLESVNNPLFTAQSIQGFAKAKLAQAKLVETHTVIMPITEKVGFIKPADIVAFDGEWWGVVKGVQITFSYGYATQQVEIERVNNE